MKDMGSIKYTKTYNETYVFNDPQELEGLIEDKNKLPKKVDDPNLLQGAQCFFTDSSTVFKYNAVTDEWINLSNPNDRV